MELVQSMKERLRVVWTHTKEREVGVGRQASCAHKGERGGQEERWSMGGKRWGAERELRLQRWVWEVGCRCEREGGERQA